ncbi:esterase/lipase family protein (plasmid) [Legionella sp. D16C41]
MSKTEDYICNITGNDVSDEPKKTGVYVVPGTGDFPLSLLRLVNNLIAKGKLHNIKDFTIVSFLNRFQGKSIDDFAQELVDKMVKNKEESVIIAGHSRGGLVGAKAALMAAKLGIKVKAVISLATPFNGSYLALPPITWFSTSVKEMEVGSAYLKELTNEILKSDIPHYFMIAGSDEVVRSGAFIQEYVNKHPESMLVF